MMALRSLAATLGLAALMAFAGPAGAESISLRADAWCPFNCAPDSDRPGYMIEVAREVFAATGTTVDYKLMPWSRALAEARRGTIDGVVGAARIEAEELLVPDEPLGISLTAIGALHDSGFSFNGVGSLRGRRIGAVKDYSYDNGGPVDRYLTQQASKASAMTLLSGEDVTPRLLRLLTEGRVDLVIESEPVLKYHIQQAGVGVPIDIIGLPSALDHEVFIAFAPKRPRSPRYAALLSEGIVALRQSGRLAAILARYGLADWGGPVSGKAKGKPGS